MCGIGGFLGLTEFSSPERLARAMGEVMAHRGPDSEGVWTRPDLGLALVHRRLAILDLSEAGRQPMRSNDGRYVLVFNGEIYNHQELRRQLEEAGIAPTTWRGHSDTEILLAAISVWGLDAALRQANGMFAIALWDNELRLLRLARDRAGEKPLYFGRVGGCFAFASELKALTVLPEWNGEIDREALTLFLRYSSIPAPFTIYTGIEKLPAGHILTVSASDFDDRNLQPYWQLADAVSAGRAAPFEGDANSAIDALEVLLRDAVLSRMSADVPLGAFLSGGIDSSTVVALMQAQSAKPVQTYTIGFKESGYDEATHASAVAQHLRTNHTELYVSPEDARGVIPDLPKYWDEPFADISQIPTLLISKLARQDVTVSLSGDGGDELFCGYNRYGQGYRVWQRMQRMPRPLRDMTRSMLKLAPTTGIDAMMARLPGGAKQVALGDKLRKLSNALNYRDPVLYYRSVISAFDDTAGLVVGGGEPQGRIVLGMDHPPFADERERMMYLDFLSYLPDDVLVKLDRASMAVSLEARVPLLDHRIVEFAQSLPIEWKMRDNVSKWVLRQVLYRYVPQSLVERPKMGFSVPVGQWLRGPLKDWGDDLLNETRLRQDGYLEPGRVAELWKRHKAGENLQQPIWNLLTFQAWLTQTRQIPSHAN